MARDGRRRRVDGEARRITRAVVLVRAGLLPARLALRLGARGIVTFG